MKAKITALNKSYLVEFKNDDQFVSFMTQHNDKINNIEILDEAELPATEKPVEMVKISEPTGWTTLEKSAFNTKEKGVEKKGMTLGGKHAEFRYEPDKNLEASTTTKVSDKSSESPAMKGSEPKASSVEDKQTAPKNDSKEYTKEETSEEPKEEKEEELDEAFNHPMIDRNAGAQDENNDNEFQVNVGDVFVDENNHKIKVVSVGNEVVSDNVGGKGRIVQLTNDGGEKIQMPSSVLASNFKKLDNLTEEDEEDFEHYETCSWCNEKFPKSDLRKEKDMGYVCHQCRKGIESREGSLEWVDDEELDEGFKDTMKKAGKYAKGAIAGAAMAGALVGGGADAKAMEFDPYHDGAQRPFEDVDTSYQNLDWQEVLKAGKPVKINGYEYTVQDLQNTQKEHGFSEEEMNELINGIDPYGHDYTPGPGYYEESVNKEIDEVLSIAGVK